MPADPRCDDLVKGQFRPGPAGPVVGPGHRAPRGAIEPCSGEGTPPHARRSGRVEAEGSLNPGTGVRAGSSLTTTGRASTVRWHGSGKQDGKAYVRNQRPKAPQEIQQLEPGRLGLQSDAHPDGLAVRGTLRPVNVAGREAGVNACGVATAMLRGHRPSSKGDSGQEARSVQRGPSLSRA